MTKQANPRDLGWVRKLPDEYVKCRSMRHAWDMLSFGYMKDAEVSYGGIFSQYSIVRHAQCDRCGVEKLEFFNREQARRALNGEAFQKFYVRYIYPQDYQFRGVERPKQRPESQDYNKELFKRVQRESRAG